MLAGTPNIGTASDLNTRLSFNFFNSSRQWVGGSVSQQLRSVPLPAVYASRSAEVVLDPRLFVNYVGRMKWMGAVNRGHFGLKLRSTTGNIENSGYWLDWAENVFGIFNCPSATQIRNPYRALRLWRNQVLLKDVSIGYDAAHLYDIEVEVYESFTFNGVDATVITVIIDGVEQFSVTDTDSARPVLGGPLVAASAANRYAFFTNVTATAIVVPLPLGDTSYFTGYNMHYSSVKVPSDATAPVVVCAALSKPTTVVAPGFYQLFARVNTIPIPTASGWDASNQDLNNNVAALVCTAAHLFSSPLLSCTATDGLSLLCVVCCVVCSLFRRRV